MLNANKCQATDWPIKQVRENRRDPGNKGQMNTLTHTGIKSVSNCKEKGTGLSGVLQLKVVSHPLKKFFFLPCLKISHFAFLDGTFSCVNG